MDLNEELISLCKKIYLFIFCWGGGGVRSGGGGVRVDVNEELKFL